MVRTIKFWYLLLTAIAKDLFPLECYGQRFMSGRPTPHKAMSPLKFDIFLIFPNLLKSDSHLPKKFIFVCFNESLLKLMKNSFYFILKALFVLKIFKFLSWHFGHVEETAWWNMERKIRLFSKFMTSQSGWQAIAIRIIDIWLIFLQKSCRKWGKETSFISLLYIR